MRALVVAVTVLLVACGNTPGSAGDAGSGGGVGGGVGGGGVGGGGVGGGGVGGGGGGVGGGGVGGGGVGGGGAGGGGASDAGATVHTGSLVGGSGTWPGPIQGVHYRSGSRSGFTDAAGTFEWEDGAPITFSAGDVDFFPATGKPKLSAWQLAGPGTCTQGAELNRLLVLLTSLDADGDPATGTALTPEPPAATQRTLSTMSDADVTALIAVKFPGRTPVAALDALDLFIRQVDSELWIEKSSDTFSATASATRSQGVTTDGTSWFFSWKLGLERDDFSYNVTKSNTLAIPLALSLAGSNHIGDVDLNGNTLWAPIEDGTAYQKPTLVEYDPTTLSAGTTHALSNTLLTQGVPWVAVDAPRASLYVAQWDPTPGIFVYSLAGVSYQKTIAIRPTLGRIQGGKVFEGSLYANLDDTAKSVFKINLDTGTGQLLFTLTNATGVENEGLAFLARPDGTLLHTLNTNAAKTAMEFRHHQRTRAPLRKDVCP